MPCELSHTHLNSYCGFVVQVHSFSSAIFYLCSFKQHNLLPSSHSYPNHCPFPESTKLLKTPHNPFMLCFTDKFIKWYQNLYFYITSCFKHKSWSRVNLAQTRLVNNTQFHQWLSNFIVFPFKTPINSGYITFVTACWSSDLPSKLRELLDPHKLRAERGKKTEEKKV